MRCDDPETLAAFGWTPVPRADEPAIESAWCARVQRGPALAIPRPSHSWDLTPLLDGGADAERAAADFSAKLLAAFRRCTRRGERLLAIEWQHDWYAFDPHWSDRPAADFSWPMSVLPDGDAYHFVAPDFRFGLVTHWERRGPIHMFGADLLDAFAQDPPGQFMRLCGTGSVAE